MTDNNSPTYSHPGTPVENQPEDKAPLYKRKWFIALVVVGAIIYLSGRGGDEEQAATPQATVTVTAEPTQLATPSATPSASEVVEASPEPTPMSPVMFSAAVKNQIADLEKDLNDMVKAVDTGGELKLAFNMLEVAANMGQLSSYTPPADIEADWTAGYAALDAEYEKLSGLIDGDTATGSQVKSQIKAFKSQMGNLEDILAKIA